MIEDYDHLLREASHGLITDSLNIALFSWKNFEGIKQITSNAREYKQKMSKNADKKEGFKSKARSDYLRAQAKHVRDAFDKWDRQRSKDFAEFL